VSEFGARGGTIDEASMVLLRGAALCALVNAASSEGLLDAFGLKAKEAFRLELDALLASSSPSN
jgi:hypothetical protein